MTLTALWLGAGWSLLVCLALFGWGDLFGRVLRTRYTGGETACLGTGVAVAIGGVLDLLHLVLPPVTAGFVLFGAAAGAWRMAKIDVREFALPAREANRYLSAAVLILTACAASLYCCDFTFQPVDDLPAYLVFPAKMLTGTLGFEPFSERRLLTSLGGLYFLQSLVLTGADFHWLHVIDPAFALIILIWLLGGIMRQQGVPLRRRLVPLLFSLLFLPRTTNLTAILLPVPLFLLVCSIAGSAPWREGRTLRQRSACLAVTVAALIAIKPLYAPLLGVFLVGAYLPRIVRGPDRISPAVEASGAAVLTILLLLPWMIGNWQQTGTPLYPLLGTGFSTARFDPSIPAIWNMQPLSARLALFVRDGLLNGPVLLLLALFAVFCAANLGRAARPRVGITGLVAWIIATLVLILLICLGGAGGLSLQRYLYPAVAAGLLLVLNELASARLGRSVAIVPVAACLAVGVFNAGESREYWSVGLLNLRIIYSGPNQRMHDMAEALQGGPGPIAHAIRRMQAAVPPRATILERLDYPFLMDFRRNPVLVADWPGATGPAPGWPAFQGSRRLASYLLGQSIRHVAYAYGNEAIFPAGGMAGLEDVADPWVRIDAKRAFDFQQSLSEMMQVCPLAFKDSTRTIIEISDACIDRLPAPPAKDGPPPPVRRFGDVP